MSKINWSFQNESGSNLNRYKATNVATGEIITFDLLRAGTINVVGTQLNADTLNQLKNAINDNFDEITSLKDGVLTNETDITTLKSNVSTNTSNISLNSNAILQNQTNITSQGNRIDTLEGDNSTNKSNISSLSNRVTTLENDNSTNKTNIESLNSRVAGLEANKNTLELFYSFETDGFRTPNSSLLIGKYRYTIEISNYSGTEKWGYLTYISEELGTDKKNINKRSSSCLYGYDIVYFDQRLSYDDVGIPNYASGSIILLNIKDYSITNISKDSVAKEKDIRINKIWREQINI